MPRALSEQEIEAFRADLCRVAERLFAENGFDGVTMRALANELGCSPMTPYRYFENKEAILAAVRTEAFVRQGVRTEKAALEHRDPEDRLRAFAKTYVAFARDEPHAYRIMFSLSASTDLGDTLRNPDTRGDVLRGWTPLVSVMEELIDSGRAFGDPIDLAHLAWVMLHGLVTLELSNKFLLGRDLDQLIGPAVDTFLRGIGAPPNSSDPGVHHVQPREDDD